MTMKTYTLVYEYYTDGSSQKTMCSFWLKSNSRANTFSKAPKQMKPHSPSTPNSIWLLIHQTLDSTKALKWFSQLTNKAHFGMPFHGHEKQTCGLLSKPWLSLFPQNHRLPYLTPVFCPIQNITLLQCRNTNISSDTDSKVYKHNFPNWPHKC